MLHPYDIMTNEALDDLDEFVAQAHEEMDDPRETEFTGFAEWLETEIGRAHV